MNKLIPPHGGYRELKSFQNAELVYDATVKFCDMENLSSDVSGAYQNLANDPKYQHFVRIPDRIIQCIDYFGITCDRAVTKARLLTYYLFIGIVDDAIDSGRIDSGRLILDDLSRPAPVFDEEARRSSVRLITEILKSTISDTSYPLMVVKLKELYNEVVNERGATSIDTYIQHRKSVGSLTAELSFVLIQMDFSGEHETLLRFMKQVGAIGCLVDSLLDLSHDRRLGLLGFKPRMTDYVKLIICILRDGLQVSLRHPGLGGLFLRAIADNVHDCFRAARDSLPHSLIADRKDEAASVA
jgi:hypothetical protein